MKERFEADLKINAALQANWALVVDWNEEFRYDSDVSQNQAANLIAAIDDPQNGGPQWLKQHW